MTRPVDTPNAPRLTAADFPAPVMRLFDQYVHGQIDRRGFLDGASRHAVGGATAVGMLAALAPDFAMGQQVKPDDPRIRTEKLVFDSPQGSGRAGGLLARPASASGKLPSVLVIHENRGLNPHIEDITRRLAVDGFLAFAPDALFPQGGYPGDEDLARNMFAGLDQVKTQADQLAAAAMLKARSDSNGRLGAVGFCYGGGICNLLAVRLPDLVASVPFYGSAPPADQVARIKAKMLIHYAGDDPRINDGWPAYEAALKAAGVKYEAHTYPGTQHGFNNDTTPRYDPAAAKLAWQRTLAHFRATLVA